MRGREAEGRCQEAGAVAVTGGWRAVAVAVLAVVKRLGGDEALTAVLWGGGCRPSMTGLYNTPFKRRPGPPCTATPRCAGEGEIRNMRHLEWHHS